MKLFVSRMAILVFSILVWSGCSAPAIPSPEPTSAPPLQSAAPASANPDTPLASPTTSDAIFDQMQFLNDQVGWTFVRDNVGEEASGLLATADGGATWKLQRVPALYQSTYRFADESIGWLAGYDGCAVTTGTLQCTQLAVFATIDGGAAWKEQWRGQIRAGAAVNPISLASGSTHTAVLASEHVLLATTDGGANWSSFTVPNRELKSLFAAYAGESDIWIAGKKAPACENCELQLWHSADGGRSWREQGQFAISPLSSVIGLTFSEPKRGVLLWSDYETMLAHVYATVDGGNTWNEVNDTLRASRPAPRSLTAVDSQTLWIPLSVGAGPIEGGLIRSTDGGTTWQTVSPPYMYSVESASFLSSRQGFIIANEDGGPVGKCIYMTVDGGATWINVTPPSNLFVK